MPSMTPADVGGAFLAAVFGEVLQIVEEVTIKAIEFKPLLNRLQLTLNQIAPTFEDIEKLNGVLDRPPIETKMFADKLEKGKHLVQKCAKVRWWNLGAKILYANRLIAFDKSLERFFNIVVTAQNLRDGRKIQESLERIETRVRGVELGNRHDNTTRIRHEFSGLGLNISDTKHENDTTREHEF